MHFPFMQTNPFTPVSTAGLSLFGGLTASGSIYCLMERVESFFMYPPCFKDLDNVKTSISIGYFLLFEIYASTSDFRNRLSFSLTFTLVILPSSASLLTVQGFNFNLAATSSTVSNSSSIFSMMFLQCQSLADIPNNIAYRKIVK